jgi:hypothetical protein
MLPELLDFLGEIGTFSTSWRVWVAVLLSFVVVVSLVALFHHRVASWVLLSICGVGISVGLVWEARSHSPTL